MAITRVTQSMMTAQSLSQIDAGLVGMSKAQQQLSTGKRINRPSDDPTGTTTALRARVGVADQTQYQRNGQDGLDWLSTIDSTLQGMQSQLQRARTLAVQGANTASNGSTALDAIADEIDTINSSLVDAANTTYLGRPVFGGTTASPVAYTTTGTGTGTTYSYEGDAGSVVRRVGANTQVRVDTPGPEAFGAVGTYAATDPNASVFEHLQALSTALRSGDSTGISTQMANLGSDLTRVSTALAKEGAAYNQINTAMTVASANQLALQNTQSNAEDVDVAQATIQLASQQTAYQAALQATSKTMQPSLLDFLS